MVSLVGYQEARSSGYRWSTPDDCRRRTSETTTSLLVKRANINKNDSKSRHRILGPNPLADYKQHKAHGHTTSDCLWGIELRRRRRMQGRDASELVSILEKPERCISVLS